VLNRTLPSEKLKEAIALQKDEIIQAPVIKELP